MSSLEIFCRALPRCSVTGPFLTRRLLRRGAAGRWISCFRGHRLSRRKFVVNTTNRLIRMISFGRDLVGMLAHVCHNAFVEHFVGFVNLIAGCRLQYVP